MRTLWALGACLAFAYPVLPIEAQSDADRLAIDLAAVRAMLGHQYGKGPISIDPAEGAQGHAPSNPGVGKLRSPSHSNALAKTLSGSVRRYSDVTKCNEGQTQCTMTGVVAHLVLSAPTIRGDTASVTASIYQNAPGKRQRVDYETVLLTLVRTAHGWTVAKENQLGIS